MMPSKASPSGRSKSAKERGRSPQKKRPRRNLPSPGENLTKPELVIGLVGAAGTDLTSAADAVGAALAPYGYTPIPIRASELMREVKGGASLTGIAYEDDRIRAHMDAGDEIRNQAGRNDAVIGLAITGMAEYRSERFGGAPATNTAFILNSLKHPAEIETMRRIYRDRFIAISVHASTDSRRETLRQKIAASRERPERPEEFAKAAEEMMRRDEHDDEHGFGQNVREAFVQGHIYVSTDEDVKTGISRYFRLFFGHPFETPTREEYAMFQSHTAALRSADLSRQVGAAICTSHGEIIAVGCNEVPKAGGGQYWPEDKPDKRDFQLGYDSNVRYRDAALAEAFQQLEEQGLLSTSAALDGFMKALSRTRLAHITEFGRPIHAEMAALLDAARRGAAVEGARLFTTTFPCHNCARHIIGAGIEQVIYREPYEKSLASALHKDAVVVDSTTGTNGKVVFRRFVGVGPPQYLSLFTKRTRKDGKGKKVDWKEASAMPHLITTETAYLTNEEDYLEEFADAIQKVDLTEGDGDGDGTT
jgi:deoxycytidylate deaminase